MRKRHLLLVLLAVDAVVLVRILWWPVDADPASSPWWLRWAFFNHIPGGHYALNLFLLVPTAALMAALWPALSVRRITLLCLVISCVAEVGQFFVPTRMPDLLDVATNTFGAFAVVFSGRRRRSPVGGYRRRRPRRQPRDPRAFVRSRSV